MEVTGDRDGLREACEAARAEGQTVGFVPTMGALHAGHRSLIARAREECGLVAVSIFVNPLQFGPSEDLASYPRDPDRDVALLERAGVDVAFTPSADEMYPSGRPEVTVDPGPIGERLEGGSRPGHFRGVCTVVAKLFGLVGPSRAYFGEKDAQQLAVVRRMVTDLDLPVEVVPCPTARERDGLAVSSRNARLSPDERQAAPCLYESLARAAWLVEGGERDVGVLKAEMAKRVGMEPLARLDYVAVVDEDTFEEVDRLRGRSRALIAAHIGSTRLIDNVPLRPGGVSENPPRD
ncbi:MAG TPA: pantoate--beta-alanine ligase [Actinomycetota bacterium]|jgi:pantoate--beta-alanine ligase|nr:pantoate--beta-alanine ligase [Actinomycetota bacterium]